MPYFSVTHMHLMFIRYYRQQSFCNREALLFIVLVQINMRKSEKMKKEKLVISSLDPSVGPQPHMMFKFKRD